MRTEFKFFFSTRVFFKFAAKLLGDRDFEMFNDVNDGMYTIGEEFSSLLQPTFVTSGTWMKNIKKF